MTIIEIPGVKRTFTSWDQVADYLLISHHPSGPSDKAALNRSPSDKRWDCPSCDVPITRYTALVHAPCLLNNGDDDSIPSLGSQNDIKGVCLICGTGSPTFGNLRNHIESHEHEEVATILGSGGSCEVCGAPRQSPEHLDDHQPCIATRAVEQNGSGSKTACPISSCSASTEDRVSMLWHVWDAHFETSGFNGVCPGCEEQLDIGDIRNHVTHLGSLSNPEVGELLQTLPESCSICGFSPFGPEQLWTHYKSDHGIVTSDGTCRECGRSVSHKNLKALQTHLLCTLEQGSGEMAGFSPEWPCPVCSTIVQKKAEFLDHIKSHPELLAFSGADCRFCGDPIGSVHNHLRCIAEWGCGLHGSSSTGDAGIKLPFQEARRYRTHHGQDWLSDQEGQEQADRLKEFIKREKESAREEARELYAETDIHQLVYKTDLIYDLVSMGEVYHPDYETQVVFERPVPDHESNPQDLTNRFDIYPKQEVIVGRQRDNPNLPIEAVVTFIDDQRMGIAPAPHEDTSGAEFAEVLSGDGNFHVVSLLHPTPFERERKSIEQARQRDEWDIIRGATELSEHDTPGASLYAGRLNKSQERAVNRALGAEDLMCIHGPPGTGKTQTLTALIELALAQGKRVLACAHSNQATDNLLTGGSTTKRTDLGSLHATVQRNEDISMVRVGDHSHNQVIQKHYLSGDATKADIVGSTANAAATLQMDSFDLVVVDEATQASQPSTLVPWLRGEVLVLAGDHHQLPPYASDELAKEQEMHISLFEYLSRRYGDSILQRLTTQYRMHRSIAEYSNQMFYDGDLHHGTTNKTWTIDDIEPLVGYHVEGDERTTDESHSKYNPDEAEVVAEHIEDICAAGVSPDAIGVVTPYSAQIDIIASALDNRGIDGHERIEIDTVDSYQGSERKVIVVSFVRSNPYNSSGFLTFPDEGYRRLNVALTRAKKHLALVGDWGTLGSVADHREPANSCAEMYAELESYIDEQGQLNRVH